MHRDEVGISTIRNVAKAVNVALNYAVRKKLIADNPAGAVEKPKAPEREVLVWTTSR